jgi:CRISPR-associated protein Cas1
MSFLYTLLTNRISSWIDGIGFDPYIGFLHKMEYGRVSLGCDLIEPFRAVFCDRLTLKLFNQKILMKGDFESRDNGIYLKRAVLKNFLQIYAGELEKEKSYGFTNGIFLDVLVHLGEWIKECLRTREVKPLRRKF